MFQSPSISLTILNYSYLSPRSVSKAHLCNWVKEDMWATHLKTHIHTFTQMHFTVKRAPAKQIHSSHKLDLALRIHHLLSGSHFWCRRISLPLSPILAVFFCVSRSMMWRSMLDRQHRLLYPRCAFPLPFCLCLIIWWLLVEEWPGWRTRAVLQSVSEPVSQSDTHS